MPSRPLLRFPGGDYVRVFPAEEVTSREGGVELDPREAGLTKVDVDAIWSSVVALYQTGLHPAIALCMRRRGKVMIDRAIGHARGNAPTDEPGAPKRLATPRTPFNLFSASKAITAMVIHLLDERGIVHLDDPVIEYLPEFGRCGKEWITLRHILTHRAGIPALPGTEVGLDSLTSPRRIYELLCDAKPVSVPGRRLAYHALTGGFVIGELVQRVTGQDIRTFLRNEVTGPLGLHGLSYGVAPDEVDDVAVNAYTGPSAPPPYSWLLERSLGVPIREAAKMSNDRRFLTSIIPSGNIIATADEACRFMQLLLEGGGGVFNPRTVRRAIAEQAYLEIDSILALPVRYGMGFMLGGKFFSLYGRDTPRAYGHIGFTNVMLWADPDREVSVSLMTSGKPFITPGQVTWLQVPWSISKRCPKTGP